MFDFLVIAFMLSVGFMVCYEVHRWFTTLPDKKRRRRASPKPAPKAARSEKPTSADPKDPANDPAGSGRSSIRG